ncbi:hypothetical protein IJI17_00965 [Candidatus Saccharibacteria bacterium]|nr:hypothetical protein [Candidatus Saccharibacteria bacterium]
MAIEDKTAKSAPAFNSSNLNQSRAASRGTYFVQTKPTRVSPLKKAAPKTNPAKILSMKLQKQKSVFEDPAPESNIHLDLSGLKTALSRLAMILLALLVAGGIGYGVYYFIIREKPDAEVATENNARDTRVLESAIARIDAEDFTGAETLISRYDGAEASLSTCNLARFYVIRLAIYERTYRGNSVPAAEAAKNAVASLERCLKEGNI